ncbi:MAG: hypothetical protein KGJ89_00775 [Patescibacteria group bacterium]|nr:hypothetical protein [Patescibacteria group bacterium]MDE2015047.1 hypothetical protein [Patescibacteria group bacterium]MDE2226475.1 hypothetical protein [Patescibacteria group bacterium]
MKNPKINKIEAVIDAKSALDMFGKSFRFDHVKGLAEWLKNSVDAYLRDGAAQKIHIPDSEQVIVVRFRSKTKTDPIRFECIDFSGTTHKVINDNFARWFDRMAAKQGLKELKTYGGHGNGGKFYMRQMFQTSRFITYRNGHLNIFGFDEDKDYGFLNGFEDKKVKPEEAFKIAGIADLIPQLLKLPETDALQERFRLKDIRFTVISGTKPENVGMRKYNNLLYRLRVHPQARNIVQTKLVYGVLDNGDLMRLEPEVIKPKFGFEDPVTFEIPEQLPYGKEYVALANEKFPKGGLTLFTSEEPFNRYGDRAALNCINFKSKDIGIIASYKISELGGALRNSEMTEFVYGECECPILEDPDNDLVLNDREHLAKTELTDALLWWICERINDLTDKMVERTKLEQQQIDLKNTSIFNDFLNRWKNGFMSQVYGEIFAGTNPGDAGGLREGQGAGMGKGETEGDGGSTTEGSGSGDQKSKGHKFPLVLLSNSDDDPLSPGNTVNCDARHPLVYQRRADYEHNVYWINTQAPLAHKIREDYGTEHVRWREYMFQRYVDIILKQTVHEMEKRGTQLTADEIDNKFDEVSKRLHDSATKELEPFLFHEKFVSNGKITAKAAAASKSNEVIEPNNQL